MRNLHVVTGAAGFVGSHLVDALLARGQAVLGVDNLVRGKRCNIAHALSHPAFAFCEAPVHDEDAFLSALKPFARPTMMWHLAANSDIAAGVNDPDIDWRDTFMTTYVVAKVCRQVQIRHVAFASTSAIYGDHGATALREDSGPLFPVSNYGAMKLASEAVLTSLAESHLERLCMFRFPNVVGGRATHGVIYDFLNKLECDPEQLVVLGNGRQRKPYLYVDDLIEAMLLVVDRAIEKVNCFNVGPGDSGCTVQRIAETVVAQAAPSATIMYGAEDRGWLGDIPQFHYSVEKIASLGWRPKHSSEGAVDRAVAVQLAERRGRKL